MLAAIALVGARTRLPSASSLFEGGWREAISGPRRCLCRLGVLINGTRACT